MTLKEMVILSPMGNSYLSCLNVIKCLCSHRCGIIGRCLAKRIVPYLNDFKKAILTFNDNNPSEENTYPCAFQIRYQGCKGNPFDFLKYFIDRNH